MLKKIKKLTKIILKSRLIYFILIVSVLLLYRGTIKIRKINNSIVPISYNQISLCNKLVNPEPCNIPPNTLQYNVFTSVTEESTDSVSLDICKSSNDISSEKLINLLIIDNTLKASGNDKGIQYSIEEFNRLGIEELKMFHGVGDVTAKAIIELRERRGGFQSFHELLDVKGIGPVKWKKIMGGGFEKETD